MGHKVEDLEKRLEEMNAKLYQEKKKNQELEAQNRR